MSKPRTTGDRQDAARTPYFGRVWFRDGTFQDRRFNGYGEFVEYRRRRNQYPDADVRMVEDMGTPLPDPEKSLPVCQWEPGVVVDYYEGMNDR